MKVGILAVQGAFHEHAECIKKLSHDFVFIRQKSDITDDIDRLIFPGGESTVQRKLIHELGMFDMIKEKIDNGMPVLGTCAGLILLAEGISNDDRTCFQTLPVNVKRNAYGRQLGSFYTDGDIGSIKNFPMRFIRAPYIESVLSDEVETLNTTDNKITAVKYKNQIGISFHPELTSDMRIHELLLSL